MHHCKHSKPHELQMTKQQVMNVFKDEKKKTLRDSSLKTTVLRATTMGRSQILWTNYCCKISRKWSIFWVQIGY